MAEAKAGSRAHLPSASLSRSSEPSLPDLVRGRASARGSETGDSRPHVAFLRISREAQGSSHLRSSQTDPTYPVIQSWSPNPRKKERAMWLLKSSPKFPTLPPILTPSSTYLGL